MLSEKRDPRTHAIIGAAMEVHRQIGYGFLEAVDQEALALEFEERGIPHRSEGELPVFYKTCKLNSAYGADFLCFDSIIVEVKALARLSGIEEAQVLNYLKATGLEIGLLVNFGDPSLMHRRFTLSKSA